MYLAIIAIVGFSMSIIHLLPQGANGLQSDDQRFPLIDMPKIMSAAQNSTTFIEKTDIYDHYLLAKATLRPGQEKTWNVTQEEYDLVYALYRNHGFCYFENLLDITLDANLEATNTTEYTLRDEPAGYPRPPVSCLANVGPPKINYDQLLIILPPSPFATVNETFNASSDSLVFSGTVHKIFSKYVKLEVFDPRGEQVAISQPQPESNGTFSQAFEPFSPLWSMSGKYSVSITSGSHNLVESPFYFSGVGCCMTKSPIHYADQGLPPLEQWKSFVPVKDTVCARGLQLIIKAGDGSPACVQSTTAQKLTERGWARQENFVASPITEIKIVDLQQVYSTGQPIEATVNYTGYLNGGIEPDVTILDANGTKIWDSCCFTHTEASVLSFHTFTFNVQGPKTVNGFVESRYPVINKTGTYTMVASLEGKTAQQSFNVIDTLSEEQEPRCVAGPGMHCAN
ncbi:MAG: hypothetical protein ACRDFB_03180 [Rhabdochlamydiaceae bacterium]